MTDSKDTDLARSLTPRQREVAALIAQGLTNDQIAERLTLTTGTVANHVAQILDRLGLQSRVQVAVEHAGTDRNREADSVLELLDRLRQVEATDVRGALQHAADVLASAFRAEKVDCFLYDPSVEMLVAVGTSDTPLGRRQQELLLNRLPLSRGGRVAWVYQQQVPYLDGHVEDDSFELPGVRLSLGIRSTLAVPLTLTSDQRGVLMTTSTQPQHFTAAQLQLLQFVGYWIGLVAREHSTVEQPAEIEGSDEQSGYESQSHRTPG